jgi:hypothetical protein
LFSICKILKVSVCIVVDLQNSKCFRLHCCRSAKFWKFPFELLSIYNILKVSVWIVVDLQNSKSFLLHCCRSAKFFVMLLISTYWRLLVKCLMFLYNFNHVWILSTFLQVCSIKFHENPSSEKRKDKCGGRNITKKIGAFHDYDNAPKHKSWTPLINICVSSPHYCRKYIMIKFYYDLIQL